MPRYVDVAVQLPVPGTYCYRAPQRMSGCELVGYRVMVPFGGRGVTGVIVGELPAAPEGIARILEFSALLDPAPMINDPVLRLCGWVAQYYQAPPGEVLRAALPPGTAVTAEVLVELTEQGRAVVNGEGGNLPKRPLELIMRLVASEDPLPQSQLTKSRATSADVARLVESGYAAYRFASAEARIKDSRIRVARLAREIVDSDRSKLARSKAKLSVLTELEAAGGEADVAVLKQFHIHAATHLRSLVGLGLVEFTERTVRNDAMGHQLAESMEGMTSVEALELNRDQSVAVTAMQETLESEKFGAFLLYGITGSGKTEVYLQLIADCLCHNRTAIVLVPEISLTPQLAARFRARFGAQVAVLHSGLTLRERYDEWHRLRDGQATIALGARSAIFAPVENVGVIVVDEEHDSSFKQEEGVRYHAKDVALVRARNAGAICVLGSATPSLESFHGTEVGRLQLLALPKRATERELPPVELVDMRRFKPDKDSMLTIPLREAIAEALHEGDQTILFLNRRGFETFVNCTACGHVFRCGQCSVSLTYHRSREQLMCHYCGHEERFPQVCPECKRADSLARSGIGTEKISASVAAAFPTARVERLDRDVASGTKIQEVLGRVARREVDILVGTQMVTKGHDFPGVTLVGVLCADSGLSLPDFRASERTFQLLTQVAGRAGRGTKGGRVLIQSYRCESLAVAAAARHDYQGFYAGESNDRRELGYPPFGYLVAIRVDGPDPGKVIRQCRRLADIARTIDCEVTVLGPAEAPLARLKGRTRWHFWLRADRRQQLRIAVRHVIQGVDAQPGVRTAIDVDPISAL